MVNKAFGSEDDLASLFTKWPRVRHREFLLLLALIALPWIGLCFLLTPSFDTAARLAQAHETTQGKFIKYEGEHAEFYYSFVVNGRTYRGYGSTGLHDLTNLMAGERFDVYYDAINPDINLLSDPSSERDNGRVIVVFFGCVCSGLLAVLIRRLAALMRKTEVDCNLTPSSR